MSAIKFLLFSLAIACFSFANAEETTPRKVICYFNNVAKYRKDIGKFIINDIPGMCTHLVYSYAKITDNHEILPSDGGADDFSFKRFTHLRKKYPGIKFIISIQKKNGQWWYNLVTNEEKKKKLYENIVRFLRDHHFDGVEIDVHHFDSEDGKFYNAELYEKYVEDKWNFFHEEAKTSGKERLSLSCILPEIFDFQMKPFKTDHLDWIGLTEHIKKPLDIPNLTHYSPLYSKEGPSVNRTISYYLNNGGNPSKMALAIPFFGKSYQLKSPEMFQLGQEAKGKGMAGKYTLVDGYMAYFEICRKIKDEGWTVETDTEGNHGPFAHHEDQWVSYDDEKSVMKKVDFAKEKNLGAIMLLTLDLDDFHGYCKGTPFPLTKTVVDNFLKV